MQRTSAKGVQDLALLDGKWVIHSELSKKLKFEHTTKWYIHKPESVLENKMHKMLWDFEVPSDP